MNWLLVVDELSVAASILTFATLRWLTAVERRVTRRTKDPGGSAAEEDGLE